MLFLPIRAKLATWSAVAHIQPINSINSNLLRHFHQSVTSLPSRQIFHVSSITHPLLFVNVLEWKEIYSLPLRTSLDTKSREFQYKLLNRCLFTNSFLNKIGIIPSPAYSFCGEMNESLEPFLFVVVILRISGLRLLNGLIIKG